MKNTLGDLHNHLMAELERLSDESIVGDKLQEEIARAKAVSQVATQIVANANLVLHAQKTAAEWIDANKKLPKMLEGETNGQS